MHAHTISEALLESMRAALERFGLTVDERQYSLERVLRLAVMALGADVGLFSVPSRNGFLHLARVGVDDQYADTIRGPFDVVLDTAEEIHVAELASQPLWGSLCASPALRDIQSLVAYPVLSPDHHPIGVMSVLRRKPLPELDAITRRVMVDSTRLIEDSLVLRSQAIRDPLTQLFNRRYFMDLILSEWRRATRLRTPVSVALIDIDNFKKYNDTAGHRAGDDVIRRVADVMQRRCRRAGDAVARFGGEEFAVILPQTSAEQALKIVDDMRKGLLALNLPHPAFQGAPVSMSGGIACADSLEAMEMNSPGYYFELADQALYAAKRAGRNRVHVYQEV